MIPHFALYRRIPADGRYVATWVLFDALPWPWRWLPASMLDRALNRLELDGLIASRKHVIEDASGRGPAWVRRWVTRVA